MSGSILVSNLRPWSVHEHEGWRVLFSGRPGVRQAVDSLLGGVKSPSPDLLGARLAETAGHFGFMAENEDFVVAATDRSRGYPVFFAPKSGETLFSNSARLLRDKKGLSEPDRLSLLEFLMAGYVTGRYTVYRGLDQLQAGEVAVYGKASRKLSMARYYEFLPRGPDMDDERLIERLAAATEQTFSRLAGEVAGRPVLVPLSGGLDSRLVLAMLKASGVRDLRAFSYGPPGNEEASRAKAAAGRLGVPWKFYSSLRSSARKLFLDDLRSDYWRASDGLCSIPNMQEYQVFAELAGSGELPPEAIVVNGQSGDFITGGHVPKGLALPGAGEDELFCAAVDKHFSLWEMLKTPSNLHAIRSRFEENLAGPKSRGFTDPVALYEYWEWQERQSKYVVSQQRTYDFFGLEWALPLWDREYCEFWREVPLGLKLGQRLYRKYLERWDYGGLFTDARLDRPIVRWPGASRAVVPLARAAGIVGGRRAKDFVYSRLKYFGHYRNQFGCYPFSYYLRRAGGLRNSVSLFVETWLRERFPGWLNETGCWRQRG